MRGPAQMLSMRFCQGPQKGPESAHFALWQRHKIRDLRKFESLKRNRTNNLQRICGPRWGPFSLIDRLKHYKTNRYPTPSSPLLAPFLGRTNHRTGVAIGHAIPVA